MLIYARGRNLTLDLFVTDRLRFHAIPVAISEHYRGRVHDYTAFAPLALSFQGPNPQLDDLIASALQMPVSPADATYYWAADDRGTADYVIAAFVMFGPRLSSLYKFYFVVLGSSCAFFLIGYRRQPGMLAALFLALAAIYAILPVIPLANVSKVMSEPPSLFEPRILDVLALVATLHLAFAAWGEERAPGWTAALIGQIAVFMFCYHARSSLAWEAVFVILINIATLAIGWRQRDRRRAWVPVVLFVAGFVALSGYKHYAYNARYFKDMGSRTIWHNALMGLGANPVLSKEYRLGVSDAMAIDAVIAYLGGRHDPRLTPGWTNENIRNSLGGHSEFDWYAYEQAARELYFEIWRKNTSDALRCYLVDKPLQIWGMVKYAWMPTATEERNRHNLYLRPFGIVPALIVVPAIVLAIGYPIPYLGLFASMLALLVTSLIPGLMFYPVPLTMMGTFLSLALISYAGILAVGQSVIHRRYPGS